MNDIIHQILDFTVGNVFGKDITCREPVHRCDDYQPGSLVELGRTGVKFFKKILMPCGLCAAVPAVKPTNVSHDRSDESDARNLIRPSELPIYTAEDKYAKRPCKDCPPSALEQNVSKIRRSVQGVMSDYQYYTGKVSDTIDTGFEHSRSLLDYLREESNVMPRMGAIGIGGLAGLVLGLRGRTFKRVMYTSTGALVMAALCYPKKAEEGLNAAKHYVNVGYNFIYGVKPGDERQLEITMPKLPRLPTSFSEFVDLTIVAGSTAATAAGSLARNAYASLSGGDKEKSQSTDQVKISEKPVKSDNKQD